MSERGWSRAEMAEQVAADIPEGWFVNLGIGLPTSVADCVPAGREVILMSENGILAMGPAPAAEHIDPWLVNAGKQPVTLRPGGAFFHHADSFAMIRGGHIDLCVLGGYEVAATGDLANWSRGPAEGPPAVGGAMDLALGAKQVWVMMDHVTRDGRPKLVGRCRYPLTAAACVRRIYTNLAVIDVVPVRGFVLREAAPGVGIEDVRSATGAPVVADQAVSRAG
jgi:3-oxoadipate CoA-transferase beta subunit